MGKIVANPARPQYEYAKKEAQGSLLQIINGLSKDNALISHSIDFDDISRTLRFKSNREAGSLWRRRYQVR